MLICLTNDAAYVRHVLKDTAQKETGAVVGGGFKDAGVQCGATGEGCSDWKNWGF